MYGNQRENIHLFSQLSVTDVLVWGQNGKYKVPKLRIFYVSSMMKNKTKSKTKTGKWTDKNSKLFKNKQRISYFLNVDFSNKTYANLNNKIVIST